MVISPDRERDSLVHETVVSDLASHAHGIQSLIQFTKQLLSDSVINCSQNAIA